MRVPVMLTSSSTGCGSEEGAVAAASDPGTSLEPPAPSAVEVIARLKVRAYALKLRAHAPGVLLESQGSLAATAALTASATTRCTFFTSPPYYVERKQLVL